VLQGFVQNLAYGEMVTVFPKATGLPGCAQTVFTPETQTSKYDIGKFIGAFSAWCYWFAWTPVVAIFTMLIGDYLIQMFTLDVDGYYGLAVYMGVGIVIVLLMLVLGSRGLEGGAKLGTILAIISIVPMVVILLGAFATGMFEFSNITDGWTAPGWSWSAEEIILVLGCFGLAQWSACAWETAAIYGPEYKEPGKDVPKALFSCGIICLILYFFVSTTVFGSLGGDGINEAGYASLVPISEYVFGHAGSYVALGLLIVAMILIIQTGFLGSSRTLHSMSQEGNLPKWFSKLNSKGMPVNAMIFVSIFNLLLVLIVGYSYWVADNGDTVMTILSASAMGYCIANGIALAAYVKTKTNPRFKDLDRPFKAPKGWKYVISIMCGLQFFIWLPCLIYWSYYLSGGYTPAILGAVVLLAYIVVWVLVQKKPVAEEV
jgi:amino acid transporter